MRTPSGEQFEIAHGDQRAVVVEVGGGLRSYTVGERRGPRRLRRGRDGDRRAAVRCWPRGRTGCEDGTLRVRRAAPPAAADRAGARATRSTASSAGRAWTVARARAAPGRAGARAPPAARLPVRARASRRVRALGGRPRRADDGDERRRRAVPVRERRAPVPHASERRPSTRRRPARARQRTVVARRTSAASRRGSQAVAGRSYDFRRPSPIGATRLDNAFTDLERDERRSRSRRARRLRTADAA